MTMASACQLPVASSSSHLKSYINFHRVTSPHCTFRLSSPWSLHDTDNILVGNYAQVLAKPGAVKWRTRVSFLPSFPKNKSRDDVKQELLKAIALLDRGAEATSEDQERVDQIARELEALNPTTEPLKSNLLNGKWELLYTTSRSILQPQRPKILRPFGKIYQAINADTLRAQNIETWPYFNQVTANLVPLNERRVAVRFDRFKIGGLVFFESTRKEMLERRKRPRPPMPIGQNSSPKFEKVRKKFGEDKTSAPLEASIENKALSSSNVTTLNNIPSLVEILAQEVREKSPHVGNMVEIDDEEPGDLANPLFPLVVRDLVDQIPKLVLPTVPLVGSNLVLEGGSDQTSDNFFESPPHVLVKRKILIVVFRVTGILPPSTGIPANNNILGFDLGVMLRSPSEFHSLDGLSMTIAADT